MSKAFDDRFPGCQVAANQAVADALERGLSREGLAIAMIMLGAELLYAAGGPQLAATTLQATGKYVDQLPAALAMAERGNGPVN